MTARDNSKGATTRGANLRSPFFWLVAYSVGTTLALVLGWSHFHQLEHKTRFSGFRNLADKRDWVPVANETFNTPLDVRLQRSLIGEISRRNASIDATTEGMIVRFKASFIFKPKSSQVSSEAKKAISQVVSAASEARQDIMVRAYVAGTVGMDWPTSWAIASEQAIRVATVILSDSQSAPRRPNLAITSFGKTRPIFPNDTQAHREANNRIELLLKPRPVEWAPVPRAPVPFPEPKPTLPIKYFVPLWFDD